MNIESVTSASPVKEPVIPAKAGIHAKHVAGVDRGFRRDDVLGGDRVGTWAHGSPP